MCARTGPPPSFCLHASIPAGAVRRHQIPTRSRSTAGSLPASRDALHNGPTQGNCQFPDTRTATRWRVFCVVTYKFIAPNSSIVLCACMRVRARECRFGLAPRKQIRLTDPLKGHYSRSNSWLANLNVRLFSVPAPYFRRDRLGGGNRGHCQYRSIKRTVSFAAPAIALPPSHSTNKKTLPIMAMRAKRLFRTFARLRRLQCHAPVSARPRLSQHHAPVAVPSKPVRNFGVPNPAVSLNRQQAPKDHLLEHRRACSADRSFRDPFSFKDPLTSSFYEQFFNATLHTGLAYGQPIAAPLMAAVSHLVPMNERAHLESTNTHPRHFTPRPTARRLRRLAYRRQAWPDFRGWRKLPACCPDGRLRSPLGRETPSLVLPSHTRRRRRRLPASSTGCRLRQRPN